jgi:predicted NAD-dependent protein-ADP-ribosyltransferase YbiA (DUF1768 family)
MSYSSVKNTIPNSKVPSFRNEFKFLSNMYPCKVQEFSCAESYFQAMKCPDRANEFIGLNGYESKTLGKRVKLRADWDDERISIMRSILFIKFQGELLNRLKAIEGDIIERNTWNDTFWGVCNGKGENHLGKLLMEVRDTEVRPFIHDLEQAKEAKKDFEEDGYSIYVDWINSLIYTQDGISYVGTIIPVTYEVWQTL